MAQREEQADAERPLALLHQLARDIVDGGDVVGVDAVAQAEAVGEQRRAEQQRLVVEHQERPRPGGKIGRHQPSVDADERGAEAAVVGRGQHGLMNS
jgi:hypothetical protein